MHSIHRSYINYCPHCGKQLDAHTNALGDRDPPADGDLSICFYCAALLTFAGGSMVLLSDDELKRIKEEHYETWAALCFMKREIKHSIAKKYN